MSPKILPHIQDRDQTFKKIPGERCFSVVDTPEYLIAGEQVGDGVVERRRRILVSDFARVLGLLEDQQADFCQGIPHIKAMAVFRQIGDQHLAEQVASKPDRILDQGVKDDQDPHDKVILAAGASPIVPKIDGIENTRLVCDYLTHKAGAGRNVVVIGGGLAGTEAACDIAPKADSVTIVEMLPDILYTAGHCLNNDQHLKKMVKDRGVKVEANAKVTKITENSVTFERDGQSVTIECDTVLNAAGFRPNDQLEEVLEDIYENVAVVGDAIAPRKILTAIHEGYHAIRVME